VFVVVIACCCCKKKRELDVEQAISDNLPKERTTIEMKHRPHHQSGVL